MYLLSGLTLNHSLNAGTSHCLNYLGSLLLRVKAEKESEVRVMVLVFTLSIFSNNAPGNYDTVFHFLSSLANTCNRENAGKKDISRPLQLLLFAMGGNGHRELFFASARQSDKRKYP